MRRRKIVESTSIVGTAAVVTLGLTGCGKQNDTPAASADDVVTSSADPTGTAEGASADTADPTGTAPGASTDTAATKPDCEGKDAFTEACGYASPTRYAALDPAGIVNES